MTAGNTKGIQVTIEKDRCTATIDATKVEVGPEGNVTVYTNDGVQSKPASSMKLAARATGTTISIREDFNTVVLNGATIERTAHGHLVISTPGIVITKPAPANDSLAQKVLEVGDRVKDGTVCIAVDLKNSEALFAPAGIIGGKATFDKQREIPAQLNKQNAHGHSDWRNITDYAGEKLSQVWSKVAPDELQGRAAPWFWVASPNGSDDRRARRGGEADWDGIDRDGSLPVPCVRLGPVSL